MDQSTTIKIDLSEVYALARNIGDASGLVRQEIAQTAYVAGAMVLQKAVAYVPVDTGTLKSSIGPVTVNAAPESVQAIVPVGAEYGIYVEKGTRYMRGRFYMGRALADRVNDIEQAFKDMADRLLRKFGGGA